MKLSNKITLITLFFSLLFIIFYSVYRYHIVEINIEQTTREKSDTIYGILMSVRKVYQKQFLNSGIALTNKTVGFLPAHSMSRISEEFRANWDKQGIIYNNVSDDPRSKKNQADSDELLAMDFFRKQDDQTLYSREIINNSHTYQFYARPIWVKKYCLKCHGKKADAPAAIRDNYDAAFDMEIGDLRGIMSIKIPIEKMQQQQWNTFIQDISFIIPIVFLLIISMLIVIRNSFDKPLEKLSNSMKDIQAGKNKKHIQPIVGDFKIVTESFNQLMDQLTEKQQEAIKLQYKAEQASEAKSAFLANMSHEIRTPMNGVLGMLNLALDSRLNKEQHHHISLAQSSANSLLSLINDILDFSKIEAGKVELELIDYNLWDMLGNFTQSIAVQVQEKNLEIILDTSNIKFPMIKGDSARLRQILTNLVGNAIKFTPSGEIKITIELEELSHDQLKLHGKVEDTGIGMSEKNLDKIFGVFSQEDATTTRRYGGTGLGLSITKRLCQLMGGGITASSEKGKGSCLSFSILVNQSGTPAFVLPKQEISSLNLLVVDDNIANTQVLKQQLEAWGANIFVANDASTALKICEQNISASDNRSLIDLAFIDMEMPDIDGLSLIKELQGNKSFDTIKMVLIMSVLNHVDRVSYDLSHLYGSFSKPIIAPDLVNILSRYIADKGESVKSNIAASKQVSDLLKIKNKQYHWPEKTRLLVVEDNHINQMVAKGTLKKIGIICDIAANGLEALDSLKLALETKPYTLVLMDCQMPEMDGYEASRQIRLGNAGLNNQHIPIIAMTANAMDGDKEKCLGAGMSDYLSKPINRDKLFEMLKKWAG